MRSGETFLRKKCQQCTCGKVLSLLRKQWAPSAFYMYYAGFLKFKFVNFKCQYTWAPTFWSLVEGWSQIYHVRKEAWHCFLKQTIRDLLNNSGFSHLNMPLDTSEVMFKCRTWYFGKGQKFCISSMVCTPTICLRISQVAVFVKSSTVERSISRKKPYSIFTHKLSTLTEN